MWFNNFNFRRRADRMRTVFDAMREVFMKSGRRHAFHADRTVLDVMREVCMQSCRRYVFHVGRY